MSITLKNPVKFAKRDKAMFFKTLHARVNSYFEENKIKKTGNYKLYIKTGVMLTLYLLPLILIITKVVSGPLILVMFAIMGIGTAGIGLGIMHDANHGTFSNNKIINRIFGYSMNILGGSSFTWKVQHNFLHHTYTNIYQLDEDIEDKPFIRLSPHGKLKGYHKFQHVYAPFLYSLATLSWVIIKDFRQLVQYNLNGLTKKAGFSPVLESIAMVLSKSAYFIAIIGLPIMMGAAWYYVIPGFVLAHLIAGFIITVIFQLAHVVEGPEHHDALETPVLENTWAIHQLTTTANFARRRKLLSWFVGGLNYQVEHHLFPNISHVHYPKISEIVRKTVAEFDLPYYEFTRFRDAFASHLKVLKGFGNPALAMAH